MKVVIRTDSSTEIGSGHLMRCLTLADWLRRDGATVAFMCRDLPGNLAALVETNGFILHLLTAPAVGNKAVEPTDSTYQDWLGVSPAADAAQTTSLLETSCRHTDWLVVDHYALDSYWEEAVRPHCKRLLVIDDLANRRHLCDLLVDHNLNAAGASRYKELVPPDCECLCGPQYTPLRREFVSAKHDLPKRHGKVKNIFLFFGGIDASGETMRACEAIAALDRADLRVEVVVGQGNPARERVSQFCQRHPQFVFHCQVDNIAELMVRADLAVGAGGTTTWERAFLGLPTIIIAVAENQVDGSQAIADAKAAWYLGLRDQVSPGNFTSVLTRVLGDTEAVREAARQALALFGDSAVSGAERIISRMKDSRYV